MKPSAMHGCGEHPPQKAARAERRAIIMALGSSPEGIGSTELHWPQLYVRRLSETLRLKSSLTKNDYMEEWFIKASVPSMVSARANTMSFPCTHWKSCGRMSASTQARVTHRGKRFTASVTHCGAEELLADASFAVREGGTGEDEGEDSPASPAEARCRSAVLL